MTVAIWILAGVSCLLLLALGVMVAFLVREQRSRNAQFTRLREATRAESDELKARIVELGDELDRALAPIASAADDPLYVITAAGGEVAAPIPASDRVVFSAAVGAPLVKVAAFTHGIRRAFSAEARNRMRFAMRQQVRSSRKARRREQRVAWREYQQRRRIAEQSTPAEPAGPAPDVIRSPEYRAVDPR